MSCKVKKVSFLNHIAPLNLNLRDSVTCRSMLLLSSCCELSSFESFSFNTVNTKISNIHPSMADCML